MKRCYLCLLAVCLGTMVLFSSCELLKGNDDLPPRHDFDGQTTAKPVIYLYPESETDVDVKLYYDGELTCTYPEYNGGWSVLAKPDGTVINKADGREYSYLFWEGNTDTEYDMTSGYVVKGEDTARFLQNTLSKMGMTAKEYNEFIKLLKYFVEIQENKIGTINLIINPGGTYTILDENYNDIYNLFLDDLSDINISSSSTNNDDVLISGLITNSPRKIIIHGIENVINKEIIDTIKQVFESKAIICNGCSHCNSTAKEYY